jgi:thymidylate synthase (FAD)
MINLLDHGSIELVETWGSDEAIIRAARMSTNKGFLGWRKCQACGAVDSRTTDCPQNASGLHSMVPQDEKLLRYLGGHDHATPFEMAGATFEVKAPIFVFREWHRHRTQSYNELSSRYTPLPDENYVPDAELVWERARTALNTRNKQARAAAEDFVPLDKNNIESWLTDVRSYYRGVQELYERGLGYGVPKELARIVLPVARYSRMRAQANLRNWLAFLRLRNAPSAQYEIRVYAEALQAMLAEKFPRTMELFSELGR